MKLVLAVAVTAMLVAVPQAVAADPNAAKISTLQKQVKTLQARVVADERELGANFEGDTCLAAQTADLIQGTWGVIDQIAQALQGGRTYFGAQTQVDDFGNCGDLERPEVPRQGVVVPPKMDFFRLLMQWLHVPV